MSNVELKKLYGTASTGSPSQNNNMQNRFDMFDIF